MPQGEKLGERGVPGSVAIAAGTWLGYTGKNKKPFAKVEFQHHAEGL